MSDDKTQRSGQDRSRINVHEDYEVQYWTKALNVSKQQLVDAVQAAGTSADKVRQHLAGQGGSGGGGQQR